MLVVLAATVLLFSCKKEVKPEVKVSMKAVSFEAAGNSVTLTVEANVDWTVSCDAEWIRTVPVEGTPADKALVISAGANEGFEARTATLTVTASTASETVKITQLAAVPSLAVDPAFIELVPAEGQAISVNVSSNAPWTASCDKDWVVISNPEGDASADVTVNVLPNTDRELRTASVVFKETVAGGEAVLTLTQDMAPLSRYTDSLALVAIYNVADGANWKASRKWELEKPMPEWPGVKLNEEGRVIEVSITNGTVTTVEWELPAEIANLTELEIFQAVKSKVKGEFPEFFYSLTKLTRLVLNDNNITGSFSSKVGDWTEMTNLYVNGNAQFAGSIPVELSNLKKLVNINIAKTAITGAVPAELSGCEALASFMAYETAITSIPDNWDQWPALKVVMLYGCTALECPLPASIGNMKKVTSLQLKNCNFTGNVPESYANLPATCNQLFINGNKLQGVVPAAVKAHANWTKWKPETNIFPQQEGYGLE